MKIKAKFKGSNSLGYENGKNYHLILEFEDDKLRIDTLKKGRKYDELINPCIYDSLKAFLNNWQVF